jgi:hypothetical protein
MIEAPQHAIHLNPIQVGLHVGSVGHAAFRLNDFTLGDIL